jgi:hypothetical protein
VLARCAVLGLVILTPLSVGRAIAFYQNDVQGITCSQVTIGQWLRDHLPPGVAVATPDVGAIGYFGNHPVLDITGLVDPELIPLVHDSDALERYLQTHQVAYVALYQEWYSTNSSLMQALKGKVVYSPCGDASLRVYKTGW